eukprot:gene2920-1902_t
MQSIAHAKPAVHSHQNINSPPHYILKVGKFYKPTFITQPPPSNVRTHQPTISEANHPQHLQHCTQKHSCHQGSQQSKGIKYHPTPKHIQTLKRIIPKLPKNNYPSKQYKKSASKAENAKFTQCPQLTTTKGAHNRKIMYLPHPSPNIHSILYQPSTNRVHHGNKHSLPKSTRASRSRNNLKTSSTTPRKKHHTNIEVWLPKLPKTTIRPNNTRNQPPKQKMQKLRNAPQLTPTIRPSVLVNNPKTQNQVAYSTKYPAYNGPKSSQPSKIAPESHSAIQKPTVPDTTQHKKHKSTKLRALPNLCPPHQTFKPHLHTTRNPTGNKQPTSRNNNFQQFNKAKQHTKNKTHKPPRAQHTTICEHNLTTTRQRKVLIKTQTTRSKQILNPQNLTKNNQIQACAVWHLARNIAFNVDIKPQLNDTTTPSTTNVITEETKYRTTSKSAITTHVQTSLIIHIKATAINSTTSKITKVLSKLQNP